LNIEIEHWRRGSLKSSNSARSPGSVASSTLTCRPLSMLGSCWRHQSIVRAARRKRPLQRASPYLDRIESRAHTRDWLASRYRLQMKSSTSRQPVKATASLRGGVLQLTNSMTDRRCMNYSGYLAPNGMSNAIRVGVAVPLPNLGREADCSEHTVVFVSFSRQIMG
jgi:hypothetical protein